MIGTDIVRGQCWQGTNLVLLARLRSVAGAYMTQASLSSISYAVFDLTVNPPATVASGTLAIASVIFDALQIDARWPVDAIGYNFLAIMPGSDFPNAPNDYRAEITFAATDGTKARAVYWVKTEGLLTTPL